VAGWQIDQYSMSSSDQPEVTKLVDYKPPKYLITAIELEFNIDDEYTIVTSKLTGCRNSLICENNEPLILNGEDQILLRLRLDSKQIGTNKYHLGEKLLTIPDVGSNFELEIVTKVFPHENKALEGLYLSEGMYCTQCEAEGFRRITFFPDRPDILPLFKTKIIANKVSYPTLLSNGHLIDYGDLDDGRHFVTWEDPFPKPSYLFALVAGNLACVEDSFETMSGKSICLKIYVEQGEEPRCEHAMLALKNAMAWDEQRFGLEYDLDLFMIVAVSHFNMGAMENKGLNIFNSRYVLADTDTATDTDFHRIESIIAHEYFHNWTGNRVTCRDWFQLSLKEGLTVFRDQEFTADMHSKGVQRIQDVRLLRSLQFTEDSGPTSHPVRPESYIEINNFYTLTVYEKGAEIVRLIHTIIGEDKFRKGLALYFHRHDGKAVTCEDFLSSMQDASGKDLSSMISWYTQSGTPEIEISFSFDQKYKKFEVQVTQINHPTADQKRKKPLPIFLEIGLLDKTGKEYLLKLTDDTRKSDNRRLLEINSKKETFVFLDIPSEPIPAFLRAFSSPVKLKVQLSYHDLFILMTREKDPFVAWDAGQEYSTRLILDLVAFKQSEENINLDRQYATGIKEILLNEKLEPALRAELLKLPSENDLAQRMKVVDVVKIHLVRSNVMACLGWELKDYFLDIYHKMLSGLSNFDVSTTAMGRRSLASVCLSYMTATKNLEALDIAYNQAVGGGSMTLTIAGLNALNDIDCIQREKGLEIFFQKWQGKSLELDKWFALNASSTLPETLEKVNGLVSIPEFDITNPNRVRSLIGTFATNNPINFHRSDGKGYKMLADHVIFLNSVNPQMASRLAIPLTRWRSHTVNRQNLMMKELQRIISIEKVSNDVFEIVDKGLVAN
jgi:aminopeptidase N